MTPKSSTSRALRVAASAACAVATSSCPAGADGAHIHVKGFSRIDAHAALATGKLVVSGTVTDDVGRPSPGAEVSLGLTRSLHGGGAAPLGLAMPESCRDTNRPPALDGPDRILLPADASGRFCVRLSLPKERYIANLEVRASGSLDGATLQMPLDLSLKPVTLRFDPERSMLDLDEETTDIGVVASTEEDGVTTASPALWVALTNENATTLGGATTDASGRASCVVSSGGANLGQPGRGELRATFAGNADRGPSTVALPVERHTRVDLTVPDAGDGRRSIGSPEDGIAIPVVATARCARSGCGASPTGTVEARLDGTVVGAAALDRGQARIVVSFALAAADEADLRLRYVPDAPWFRPTGELVVTQPLKGPSAWKGLPLAIAGLGAIAWLVMARLPRRIARDLARSSQPRPPRGGARVDVLRSEATSQGWRGQVVDADKGDPVANARVSVERRGFERTDAVARAASDAQGMFALEPIDSRPGDELVADGPLHAMLRGPLPPTGELRVALVLRRRALLDRLIAWARRRGRPFDAHPDPTPAHVRRVAGPDLGVVRWANAVERAAYGGGVVDEQVQGDVDRLAPSEAVDAVGPIARGEGEQTPRARPKRPRR